MGKIQKLVLAVFIISLGCGKVYAKSVPPRLPLEVMTEESNLIVIGKVIAAEEKFWTGEEILRGVTAEIEVERTIKGLFKENKVLVRYHPYSAVEESNFEKNERVLLFLKKIDNKYYETVETFSGKVKIMDNKVYVYDTGKDNWTGEHSITLRARTFYPKILSLDECIKKIKFYIWFLDSRNEKK